MPCRISVFSRRKSERSPREKAQKLPFGGFSCGDLHFRHRNYDRWMAKTRRITYITYHLVDFTFHLIDGLEKTKKQSNHI